MGEKMLTLPHVINLIIGLSSVGLIAFTILFLAFKAAEYLNEENKNVK